MKDESKQRTHYNSGLPTEPLRGYCRAVQVGDRLFISGTTALNEKGVVVGGDSVYRQTRAVIENIREVVKAAGFSMSDIVRTRLFVVRMSEWKEYARAHREVFDSIRPASSIVEVSRLMDPRFLIEMEAEAIRGCEQVAEEEVSFTYE
ncbi:MAG: RidA family protein [Bdellovibrionales bacterium]|nr:RidA family protein [Bdellovibrionales bacterium]